jgi:hypothetical protein
VLEITRGAALYWHAALPQRLFDSAVCVMCIVWSGPKLRLWCGTWNVGAKVGVAAGAVLVAVSAVVLSVFAAAVTVVLLCRYESLVPVALPVVAGTL